MTGGCVFCQIANFEAPATVVEQGAEHLIIEPLGPHAPGHVLVVPRLHRPYASTDARLTGRMFEVAALYASWQPDPGFNLLVSDGAEATQTVLHLHVHVIPRGPNDGLPADWPWMRENHQ